MTRYLSLALGAAEPMFGQSIMELERASGRPSADIRLGSELVQQVRTKITELGLDPDDTTGPELYQALHDRLQRDNTLLSDMLHITPEAAPSEALSAIEKYLSRKEVQGTCYALKTSVAKRLLKKKAPKATMKALGYRSLDSMLKHEQPAAIYAAAAHVESASWHTAYRQLYAKLQPGDFEQRAITIIYPKAKRWTAFAQNTTEVAKQNIMPFKELGAIVLLPIQARLDGLALTTLLLVLHYMNDIRAYSSFIKLQQVKPTFGKTVERTADTEPMTAAELAGQPVPWRVIQRYYGRLQDVMHPEVFEPHVQAEDLQWHDAEEVLAKLHPSLAFWRNTQYTCMLHDNQPVSLNALDVALSYCNHLPFADRIVHFVREHLWHELMTRYLHQENLEIAVRQQLSRELVDGQALAES